MSVFIHLLCHIQTYLVMSLSAANQPLAPLLLSPDVPRMRPIEQMMLVSNSNITS